MKATVRRLPTLLQLEPIVILTPQHYPVPLLSRILNASSPGQSAQVGITNRGLLWPLVDVLSNIDVSAPTDGSTYSSAYASGDATLVYYFEIVGPTATVPALIQASGLFATSGLPPAGIVDRMELQIAGPGLSIDDRVFNTGQELGNSKLFCSADACSGSIRENSVYELQTNKIYDVVINVSALVSGSFEFTENGGWISHDAGFQFADASVDPYFTIAPWNAKR